MIKLYGAFVNGLLQEVSHCQAALNRKFPGAEVTEVKHSGKGSFMRRRPVRV